MKTWGDLLEGVRRAIAREDWDEGEAILEHLEREAAHQATPGALASAAFCAGMFHDAKGELARAEARFGEALSWDERAHGPEHQAIADALRSIAIVQGKRGKLQESVATRRRVAEVQQALGSRVLAAEALVEAGDVLLKGGYYRSAVEICTEALALLRDQQTTAARAQRVYAYLVQSECMRASDLLPEACDRVILATAQGHAPVDEPLRKAIAVAWDLLARLARLTWRDEGLAVLALAVARDLTPDRALAERLARQIAESPEAELGRDRVDGYVVSRRLQSGEVQLVHPHEGLCYALDEREGAPPLARGDRVTATVVDRAAAVGYRITGVELE